MSRILQKKVNETTHKDFLNSNTFKKIMQFIVDLQSSLYSFKPPYEELSHPIALKIESLLL